jgi:NADPH-dependent glutamate synthase beta subunit-like oxidoreductase
MAMPSERRDLTSPPDLSLKHQTGPARTTRPIYVDLLPPCNHACPAGENIQAWLAHAQAGRLREAWETILDDNPLPAVHGRVCYHPCESACNRAQLDTTVSIHAVERFLGDRAAEEGWRPRPLATPSGKRVLVVGAGPSGLSAAYHLARLGHAVEIRDAGPKAGGMMRFGIPAYRLPRDVLDAEIARIEGMGVKLVPEHRVRDLLAEKKEGGFDAVFVAVGAHLSKRTEIPARDAGRILDAVGFLREVEDGRPPRLGRRVAVYGGGNTAMDAARTVLRLGHEPVIVYRRDRSHMPAHEFEADEAEQEGVVIRWLRSIHSIEGQEMTVEEMELDAEGRPHGTGRFETLEADDLILALGQETDTAFLHAIPDIVLGRDGTVKVGPDLMTGHPGIFAGGDMVPAERTVTVAVGHGKKAARHIDAYLRGTPWVKPPKPDLATYDKLHLWYFTDAGQRPQEQARLGPRLYSFEEVVHGLGPDEAVFEARRCLSCGNCYECDGCLAACPEAAVIKLGPGNRYRFDYDRCTGCAVCFEQCPCHAIEMIPEHTPANGNEG